FPFSCFGYARDLHSFPTRRSSDLRRKTLRRGARNAGMGDGAFELLLSAPHRRATRASAAAARTEDGVQRRDIDRKDPRGPGGLRSEEHTSELQSRENLVCRLLLEK